MTDVGADGMVNTYDDPPAVRRYFEPCDRVMLFVFVVDVIEHV